MSDKGDGTVLIAGCEPCAFSAALELTEAGLSVHHVYPQPLGLLGSSRDLGLTYPELGEPWERLAYALGEPVAQEFHNWSKLGIQSLHERLPEECRRGSRLSVTRTEGESRLLTEDAVSRSKPPLEDQVRLMSGAAASNYAPIDGAHMACFETGALSFLPVRVLEACEALLQSSEKYQSWHPTREEWSQAKVLKISDKLSLGGKDWTLGSGDVCLVAAGMETPQLLDRFSTVLLSLQGQSFRTPPLKETTRSSVIGISAGWGSERYRFDQELRLLGCGVSPVQDPSSSGPTVHEETLEKLLQRASQMFTDFTGSSDSLMKWAVEFTGTCDGLPLLGALPGDPTIQVLTGFGTAAWSRGWHAGRVTAAALMGEEEGVLARRCSPARFFKALKI